MATKPLVKKPPASCRIDFEVAATVLAEILPFCAKELAEERDAASPNLEKIEALEKQVLSLIGIKFRLG